MSKTSIRVENNEKGYPICYNCGENMEHNENSEREWWQCPNCYENENLDIKVFAGSKTYNVREK